MTVPKLQGMNLNEERTLHAIQEEANRIIQNDLPDEAFHLDVELARSLSGIGGQPAYSVYEKIRRDLSWLFFPILPEEKRFELLRTSFLRALKIGINLDNAFTCMAYSIPPFIWPEVAPRYLATLRENIEEIGMEPIEVRGELELQPPTLGKYFTDFHLTLGDRKVTPFDVLHYINQDPDIVRLSPQDKELLKRAFRLYEGLKPLSLAEIREHLTPEEQEEVALGALPAPTPEEREILGIPFTPAPPPIIRLEQRPPPAPTPPPVDLRAARQQREALEVRMPEAPPRVELRPQAEAPIQIKQPPEQAPLPPPAPPPPPPTIPEVPATEQVLAKPAGPVLAKTKPPQPAQATWGEVPAPTGARLALGERRPAEAGRPTAMPTAPAAAIPITEPTPPRPPSQPQSFIRPIGKPSIPPPNAQPTLEGNIVDLKGE